MTNAICSRIANASPSPSEDERLVAGGSRRQRGSRRSGRSTAEPERPLPTAIARIDLNSRAAELAEVVDQRHDRRVVGGHGRRGPGDGEVAVDGRPWRRRRRAVRRRQPWAAETRGLVGVRRRYGVRAAPTRRLGVGGVRGREPARRRLRPRASATGVTGPTGASGGTASTARRLRGRLARAAARCRCLTASWMSVEALRNSRMLLPSDAPTSGSLPGPRMSRAITRMMISSGAPMSACDVVLLRSGNGGTVRRTLATAASPAAARVAQGGVRPSRGRPPRRAPAGRVEPLPASPDAAPAMPRDTFTSSPPPGRPPRRRRGRRPCRENRLHVPALGADARHEERQSGSDRADRPQAHRGAVAPTTRPTVPPGPQPAARRATRAWSGSAGASVARVRVDANPWTSPAPGFDVRHRTYANRSARARSGAIASSPRYGLTVTASAASASNSAVACRAAVDPMSPRFASAMTGTRPGSARAEAFEGGHPRRPEGLEEREVGLDRRRVRQGRLERGARRTARRRQGHGRTPRAVPRGRDRARGRGPSSSAAERAASRSRYAAVTVRGDGDAVAGRRGGPATPPPGCTSQARTRRPGRTRRSGAGPRRPSSSGRAAELGQVEVDALAVDVEERDPVSRRRPLRRPRSGRRS